MGPIWAVAKPGLPRARPQGCLIFSSFDAKDETLAKVLTLLSLSQLICKMGMRRILVSLSRWLGKFSENVDRVLGTMPAAYEALAPSWLPPCWFRFFEGELETQGEQERLGVVRKHLICCPSGFENRAPCPRKE